MYDYIFKYIKEITINKSIMIYGNILAQELKELLNSIKKISIIDENLDKLILLKKEFPELEYNQSLYFIKEKFDFLIILTDSPITPKNYLNKLGVYINIEFINSIEDYHRIVLTDNKKDFKFLERVNLYKKETVISLYNNQEPKFLNENLLLEIPQVVIEFYSDFKLDLKNTIKIL